MGMTRSRVAAGTVLLAGAIVLALAVAPEGTGSARASRTAPVPEPPAAPDELARLAALLRDRDIDVRVSAAVELRGFGERAVPVFLDLLRGGDRALAVRSLGKMGAAAAAAVPSLTTLLDADPALRPLLIEALASIGDREAAASLLPLLHEPELVLATLRALAKLKPDTPEAVPAIAAVIDPRCGDDDYPYFDPSKDDSASRLALHVLEEMGTAAAPALPTLLELIRNEALLSCTIRVVQAIGPAAQPAIPALVEVIIDEERRREKELEERLESPGLYISGCSLGPYPNYDAEEALGAIGEAAIPAVFAMLAHDLEGVRGAARDILAQMGEAVVPHLAAAAVSPDAPVRKAAARAMAKAAKSHPEFLALLAQLAKDEDVGVRRCVASALGWYGQDAMPLVIAMLGETDNDTVEAALGSVERIQPRDPAAVPPIVRLLEHEGSTIRWSAAEALAAMGDAAVTGIPALAACLGDECPYMQEYASKALAKLGDVAVPALLAKLDLANADGQRNTLALLSARPLTEETRAAIERMVLSADVAVRVEAASALAAHDVESESLLPILVAGLGDERQETRSAAAKGIQALGPRAAVALPDLFAAVKREGERESNKIYFGDMLASAGRDDPGALAALLSEESFDLWYGAKCALGKMGDAAVPTLRMAIAEGPSDARGRAIEILQHLAKKSEAARAALLDASRSAPDPEVRRAVLVALWHTTRDAPAVVPGLLDLARAGSVNAAGCLAEIGAQAAFAVEEIRALHSATEDEKVRSSLAKAIEAIESR